MFLQEKRRINIYSDVLVALNKGRKEKLNSVDNPSVWPFIVFEDARAMMKAAVKEKLGTVSSNRAGYN